MNAEQIAEIIKKHQNKIDTFGLRAMTESPVNGQVAVKIGDQLENSYDWMDGESTDTELDGTCAVGISWTFDDELTSKIEKALSIVDQYHWQNQVVLVGGEFSDYGNDEIEIIIRNAKVLAIIEME